MFGCQGNESSDLSHLVLTGLFMSRDLPLQVFNITLQGADQPKQPLPLLLQFVYISTPVINPFL